MKITLENIDIWQCREAVYCKRCDGHLLKIQSPHIDKVTKVLEHLKQGDDWQSFEDEDLSAEERNDIIKFLVQNQLARHEYSNKQAHQAHKQLGVFASDDIYAALCQELHPEGFLLDFKRVQHCEDLEGIQMLLVVSPVFDHYHLLEDISNACYRCQLPLLYAEFSPTAFSLGPLVEPSLGTASLACYMKRKEVNLSKLNLYSEFICSEDKKQLQQAEASRYPYFHIGLQLLQTELAYYWKYKGQLSMRLMDRQIVLDFLQFQCEQCRVLKDPTSELFAQATYTPFNG